jgi:hypothetical protein
MCHIYSVNAITQSPSPAAHRHRLILLGRLQEAEAEHDHVRRNSYAGATADLLDADKAAWSGIGEAIAAVAELIARSCAASAFCEARPKPEQLAARMAESIDDQVDREAWLVIDAAAQRGAWI